jgi:hypothetical protein
MLTATVYKALNIINNKVYAIKLELCLRDTGESSVEREYHVLKWLKGGAGIPCVHWFGRESCYDALVLDLLGPSLHDLLTQHKIFCLRTVIHLGDQLVCDLSVFFATYRNSLRSLTLSTSIHATTFTAISNHKTF